MGTLDLEKGDGRVETSVGDAREFLVRFTVDGERRLPGSFGLTIGGLPATGAVEDPAAGELRAKVPVDPAAPAIHLQVQAHPYLPATAKVEPIPPENPVAVDLALVFGGALHLRLALPADNGARPVLRRLAEDGTTWNWSFVPGNPVGGGAMLPGPDGLVRLEPLEPGTYRVADTLTGLTTPPVEVASGGDPARAELDLSKTGWASGRLVLPKGTATEDARIRLEAPGLDTQPEAFSQGPVGTPLRNDGTFRIRVPGDRAVTLRAWHPVLAAAPDGGTAVVTGPRDDILLRLVPGVRAFARVDPAPKPSPWLGGRPRVLLYRGEPEGTPDAELDAVLEGDRVVFGGFEPGTWTLWIDLLQGAPVVVRGASLGEGETDLGTLRPAKGGSIRVRIQVGEGQDCPRVGLFAWRLDEPRYSRGMNSRGEPEPVLEGLGPGRFRISAGPTMGGTARIAEIVDLDGSSERVLTLDLR